MILKNRLIMKEGRWNGTYYSFKEIEKAFKKLPNKVAIFLEFKETVDNLIGIAKNFKLNKKDKEIRADIYLIKNFVDLQRFIIKDKAGFMPKIMGKEEDNKMKDFKILSLGMVSNPCFKE